MRRLVRLLVLALLPAALVAFAAEAQTLDRIVKEKKIRITAEVTSPPFGILYRNGEPDGSEIATARQLAKDMGVELELVQVTAPNRIPALLSGRADVAISSLSITVDRAKTVMFANPHGALSIVIAAPAGAAIKSAAELEGKRIGITRATLEEAEVPKVAPRGTDIVFFDDIGEITDANDAFLRMVGFTRKELEVGAIRYDELTPPEWLWKNQEVLAELKAFPGLACG